MRQENLLGSDIFRYCVENWLTITVVYKIVLMFNKLSVVCLYYRIFAVATNAFRIACHAMSE